MKNLIKTPVKWTLRGGHHEANARHSSMRNFYLQFIKLFKIDIPNSLLATYITDMSTAASKQISLQEPARRTPMTSFTANRFEFQILLLQRKETRAPRGMEFRTKLTVKCLI